MKKIIAGVVVLLLVAGAFLTLQSNKARSEAKLKSVVVRPVAVAVADVSRQRVADSLSLVGTIVANREVTIASETAGRIRTMSGDVGDFKSAGSVLVQVDDELKRTAVRLAEATYNKALKDLDRVKQVQVENILPEQNVDNAAYAVETSSAQLAIARRQLRDARITVPFSGVVSARFTEVGATLQPGTPIASIVDVSTMKVKLNVAEKDVFSLRLGQQVEVASDLYPGVTFAGRITGIGAKADEAHTYPVEVSIPNRGDHPLKAGMFGRVFFNTGTERGAIAIPRAAIIGSVKQPQVYVVEKGVAKLRDITVGTELGTDIEVLRGVSPGEKVVVSGQNNLRDNMQVETIK